jgi:hypothetical protein
MYTDKEEDEDEGVKDSDSNSVFDVTEDRTHLL